MLLSEQSSKQSSEKSYEPEQKLNTLKITENNKYLIIEPTNGLCNRLRAIASGYVLSQFLNWGFLIKWNPNKEVGYIELNELFSNIDHLLFTTNITTNITPNITPLKTITITKIYNEQTALDEIINSNTHVLLLNSGGNFKHPNMSIATYQTLKHKFYKSLLLVKHINDIIYDFTKENFIKPIIGVQIRRTDRKTITPKTEMFAKKINSLSDQNKQIFLCTDDINEFKRLRDLIDSSIQIIQYPKQNFNRDSKFAIHEAIIDWYLLSMCETIIYSHGSSFGYEACIMGKRKNGFEMRKNKNKTENELRNLPILEFV